MTSDLPGDAASLVPFLLCIGVYRHFATELNELNELREYEREGLLKLTPEWISVTPKGRMLVRHPKVI